MLNIPRTFFDHSRHKFHVRGFDAAFDAAFDVLSRAAVRPINCCKCQRPRN